MFFVLFVSSPCCAISLCGSLASFRSVVKFAHLLSAGLDTVPPGSPMVMSAAQCVMLARSAARAERTEVLKETKSLSKRKGVVIILLLGFPDCCDCFFWDGFVCHYLLIVCMKSCGM